MGYTFLNCMVQKWLCEYQVYYGCLPTTFKSIPVLSSSTMKQISNISLCTNEFLTVFMSIITPISVVTVAFVTTSNRDKLSVIIIRDMFWFKIVPISNLIQKTMSNASAKAINSILEQIWLLFWVCMEISKWVDIFNFISMKGNISRLWRVLIFCIWRIPKILQASDLFFKFWKCHYKLSAFRLFKVEFIFFINICSCESNFWKVASRVTTDLNIISGVMWHERESFAAKDRYVLESESSDISLIVDV